MGRRSQPPNKREGSVVYSPMGRGPLIQSIVFATDESMVAVLTARTVKQIVVVRSLEEATKALDRIEVLSSVILCVHNGFETACAVASAARVLWPRAPCSTISLVKRGPHVRSQSPHLGAREVGSPAAALVLVHELHDEGLDRRLAQVTLARSFADAHDLSVLCRRFVELVALGVPEEDQRLWLGHKSSSHHEARARTYAACKVRNFADLRAAMHEHMVEQLLRRSRGEHVLGDLGELLNQLCSRGKTRRR
jgi:hypothetical protein